MGPHARSCPSTVVAQSPFSTAPFARPGNARVRPPHHRALRRPAVGLEETCDEVLRKVRPDPPADDIVLLLARTSGFGAPQVRTWRLPMDPAAVAGARRMASGQLAGWGLAELEFPTELIVSELVTNAIRYGNAPIELRLIRADVLVCEVSDGSSVFDETRTAANLCLSERPSSVYHSPFGQTHGMY
ncbi:ATP-binding protein [Streptomyces coeruleorubidus]|uniref:ATP-binding protein n=1 Tax=Streptomyces coeruleorubidus TaxID=116188 RepID=UPI003CCFF7E9